MLEYGNSDTRLLKGTVDSWIGRLVTGVTLMKYVIVKCPILSGLQPGKVAKRNVRLCAHMGAIAIKHLKSIRIT